MAPLAIKEFGLGWLLINDVANIACFYLGVKNECLIRVFIKYPMQFGHVIRFICTGKY